MRIPTVPQLATGMNFGGIAKLKRLPVAYTTTVKAADESLDALRDHISRFLAGRMAEEFRNGGSVTWTPNLAFSPEGLVYRPGGLLGRKDSVLLPYEQFGRYDFNQGTFRLWEKGNPKPVSTENSSTGNFYPGYYLLLDLFYRETSPEAVN